MSHRNVCVIGGGPAGAFAAIFAARNGHTVTLYEKNEKIGKKLYITGKGRCNLTNACDTQELFQSILSNEKFLYSAIYGFDNWQVMGFFEDEGLSLKTERGNRVFPISDHSSDVIAALNRALRKEKVSVQLNTEVLQVIKEEEGFSVVLKNRKVPYDCVVICTGGLSYASTGSTGDGFRFAEELGHSVTDCYPSLVPFETKESYVRELQGLSLKNVTLSFKQNGKVLREEFGEMLFTHFGVSGPLVLSASAELGPRFKNGPIEMHLDLKPVLSEEQLDARMVREFSENPNKQFKNAAGSFFPAKLTPVMIRLSGISPDKKVNEITREERTAFIKLIKDVPMTATGLRGYNEAIITKGGIKVKEINPSTMESKLVPGLYFAGEVLDADAYTGGYNLQIAWSTGHLAGSSIE